MKAYMWRDHSGRWIHVIGHFRTVADARERWCEGALWGHYRLHLSMAETAEWASRHVARADELRRGQVIAA